MLWPLVAVQATLSASIQIIIPVIPSYLPTLGVHDHEQIVMWTGVLSSSTAFAAAATASVWGRISDRIGHARTIAITGVAIAILTLLMGICVNVYQMLALRVVMGTFSGFAAASLAMVSTRAPRDRIGYALGWMATAQLLGGMFGPLAGGLIADLTGNMRSPFFLTSVLALAAATLVMILFGKTDRRGLGRKGHASAQPWKAIFGSQIMISLLVALFTFQFAARGAEPLVPLIAKDLLGANPHLVTLSGLALSIAGLGNLSASPFLGRRSDQIGHRKVILISLFGLGVMTLAQFWAQDFWVLVALRFGSGVFIGGVLPPLNALVVRNVDEDHRATAFGAMSTMTFLGAGLGPLGNSAVAARLGLHYPFLLSGMLFLSCYIWLMVRVPRPPTEVGAPAEAGAAP